MSFFLVPLIVLGDYNLVETAYYLHDHIFHALSCLLSLSLPKEGPFCYIMHYVVIMDYKLFLLCLFSHLRLGMATIII